MKCRDEILIELLQDTELANENDVTLHLAECTRCQTRIEELAADQDSWDNAIHALNESKEIELADQTASVVIAIDKELSGDLPMQVDQISLDFLDPPSHPEMLGRIGRYEAERLIGAGGMGIVIKAFDTELHRPVAVKVLAPHLAHSGGARQRFAREAQSAAAVVHENVVPIHNVDVAGKLPFLVMQYVPGESLQGRVDRSGPLSVKEVLRIGAQIANGLAAAHEQGLVHRDVKPGNILLEESVDRVLISDFGLARAADDASVTRSGVIAGTPHYMSPEQARGESIDTRSDLFGLGSVLYFMCTGHPPFRANGAMGVLNRICNDQHRPVDEVNEQVPGDLADLIDRLLAKSANKRPATATEVAMCLTSQLQGTRSPRFRKRSRPSLIRKWVALGVTVLAAVALCVAFLLPDAKDTPGLDQLSDSFLLEQPQTHGDRVALPVFDPPTDELTEPPNLFTNEPPSDFQEAPALIEPVFDAGAQPSMLTEVPREHELNPFYDPNFDEDVAAVEREVDLLDVTNVPLRTELPKSPFTEWEAELSQLKNEVQEFEGERLKRH